MSQKHASGQRLLCAAGITLALLGLSIQGAVAQEVAQQAQAAESLTVVKDAETGQLRAPTAAEAAALKVQADAAKSRQRSVPQTVQKIVSAKGHVGWQMTDESMSMSVAVRKADGSIERQCFDSHAAGTEAVAKGHVHTNQAVTE
jgi:hypothetical protein